MRRFRSNSPRRRTARLGFALEATLVVLLLMVVLVGAVATGAATMTRTSNVDQSTARLVYAVDGAADQVMSQLIFLIQQTGIPTAAQVDSLPVPDYTGTALEGIVVTDTVRTVGTVQRDSIRGGSFQGLFAQYANYDLDITARDRADNLARSIVRVEAQLVPIFQFGVFFNEDLEITPADSMFFAGRIHSNGDIYLCSNGKLFFNDWITTPNRLIRDRKDQNNTNCNNSGSGRPWILSSGTTYRQLGFDSRGANNTSCCSNAARFRDSSVARFGGRVQTGAFAVDSLNVPLPPGVPARTIVEPRTGTEPLGVRLTKLAYIADWYLSVDYNDITSVCANISSWSTRPASKQVPSPTECASIFTGRTQAFWDDREERWVRTIDVDVGALRTWVLADTGRRSVQVFYLEVRNMPTLDTPAGVSASSAMPALRLRNGRRLHGPVSWSSHVPIYIQGDYNYDRTLTNPDTAWRPSAVISDALTFLSGSWLDSDNTSATRSRSGGSKRNYAPICLTSGQTRCGSYGSVASANNRTMYVRAAIAAGHSPTTRNTTRATANAAWFEAGGSTDYGGGLHNFPRFLENWTDIPGATGEVNFQGSLVSLFYSRVANWDWRQNPVYEPPARIWSFDMRFRLPCPSPSMGPTTELCLPPGTPKVGSVYQIAYRPVY